MWTHARRMNHRATGKISQIPECHKCRCSPICIKVETLDNAASDAPALPLKQHPSPSQDYDTASRKFCDIVYASLMSGTSVRRRQRHFLSPSLQWSKLAKSAEDMAGTLTLNPDVGRQQRHLLGPSSQWSRVARSAGDSLRAGGGAAASASEPGPSATSVTIADSADMRRPRLLTRDPAPSWPAVRINSVA